jgi:glycosyltransferase involved in cell wall biosynthesis
MSTTDSTSGSAPREASRLQLNTVSPDISVIIPVYNGVPFLDRCLGALSHVRGIAWECIVVDDGSTDGSGDLARAYGARVVRTAGARSGPGQARNLGAQLATAPLLCFLDADVLARPETLADFIMLFDADPGLTAAFGSYDTTPDVQEHLSRYRNLLHHYVHQESQQVASTFWAGCGAIRRDAFLAIGGFHPEYNRPSIEDIELGYRLCAAGGRIELAKHIQVKHLKRWTFLGILKTDIFDRALPWTTLIVRTGNLPNDLNLQRASRASAAAVYLLAAILVVAIWQPLALVAAALPLTVLVAYNRKLYRFLLEHGGHWFLLRALPMHWLYYAYSALVFAGGMSLGPLLWRGSARARRGSAPPEVQAYPMQLPPLDPLREPASKQPVEAAAEHLRV